MSIYIKNSSYAISASEGSLTVRRNVDLVIEGGRVECIDFKCDRPRGAEVINGSSRIVVPGFINTHIYIVSHLLSELSTSSALRGLLSSAVELEGRVVDEELASAVSRLICTKLLLSGFIGFFAVTSHSSALLRECREHGQYIATGPALSSRLRVSAGDRTSICDSYERCVPVYTLRILDPDSTSEAVSELRKAADAGFKRKIEVSRTRREVFAFKRRTGKWPIEYLYLNDLIENRTMLVHLNWISSMEIEHLRESGAYTSILPLTSMYASEGGFPPVFELMSKGVPVTIGSEGLFNSSFCLFDELRALYLLHEFLYGDRLSLDKLLYSALYYPYEFLGLASSGLLERGSPANVVVLKVVDGVSFSDPISRALSGRALVEYVVIDGSIKLSPETRCYYDSVVEESYLRVRRIVEERDLDQLLSLQLEESARKYQQDS